MPALGTLDEVNRSLIVVLLIKCFLNPRVEGKGALANCVSKMRPEYASGNRKASIDGDITQKIFVAFCENFRFGLADAAG
jgi:hypothetical protein